ncbi:SusE domain-containing protein [Chitinophaga sp.]|uniref:SusE domain-containing protein n=1 Tax=Chitinophaga sp. TaxID=1869181 RepID=UPI0031E32A4D
MSKLYYALAFCLIAATACKKDGTKLAAKDGTSPVMQLSAKDLILEKSHAADSVLAVNFTHADFGYSAIVIYALEIDRKGGDFSQSVSIDVPRGGRKLTVGELNGAAMGLGMPIGVSSDVEVRVRARISPAFPAAYSERSALSLSPYLDLKTYKMMYVPGSYQGWAPENAPGLADVGNNDVFEGYVHLGGNATQFKITAAPNWDVNYGGTSNANAGTLVRGGGDLSIQGTGYYLFKVDMKAMTWSADKTSWSVAGPAVKNNGEDVDLTFDEDAGTWSAVLDLDAGGFKFRANRADVLVYGDNRPGDPFLDAGGPPIKIDAAGSYRVTLDLRLAGNYSYSISKQ